MAHPLLLGAVIALLNFAFVEVQGDSELSAKNAFAQNNLVPNPIPAGPDSTCSVVYPTSSKQVNLGRGTKMEPKDTLLPPTVSWEADSDTLYTLIMIDADAPTPQQSYLLSPYLHWLITNIPGSDVEAGDPYATYVSPSPLVGPAHRYAFVIYKQYWRVNNDLTTENDSVVRTRFSISQYIDQHNMSGPIAGNFFYEQTNVTAPAKTPILRK